MCGICGLIAPRSSQQWKFERLGELLRASQKRGTDATGIVYVNPNESDLVVLKDGEDASEFTKTEEFAAHREYLPHIVLGHTRGSSPSNKEATPDDNVNNHPFYSEVSGLAIVHNGLVHREMWENTVGEEGGLVQAFDGHTDSEVILRLLETVFLKDTVEEDGQVLVPDMLDVIEDATFNLSGNFAFGVLARHEPNKIWLVKHDRPLVLAHSPKNQAILFASDDAYLKTALQEIEHRFDFFYDYFLPEDVMITEIGSDLATEITINPEAEDDTKLFEFTSRPIEPPTRAYAYHQKAAEMIANGEHLPDEALV